MLRKDAVLRAATPGSSPVGDAMFARFIAGFRRGEISEEQVRGNSSSPRLGRSS